MTDVGAAPLAARPATSTPPRIAVWADAPSTQQRWRALATRFRSNFQIDFESGRSNATLTRAPASSTTDQLPLGKASPELVVIDVADPSGHRLLLDRARVAWPRAIPVVVIHPRGSEAVAATVAAMRDGAWSCLAADADPATVYDLVCSAIVARRAESAGTERPHRAEFPRGPTEILGRTPAMREIHRVIAHVAPSTSTVLVTGESGTGKDLVARALHERSARAGRSMVCVNCAALPGALLESELFGYERGAFTGAQTRKLGLFELADRGTLFLDEITDLRVDLQAKLLRVLDTGEFHRIGSASPVRADVRVIAATNRDVEDAVASGDLRRDLFHRLDVVRILLPPLRERADDIEILVRHFLGKKAMAQGRRAREISPEAIAALRSHAWPGNVRELENLVERLLLLGHDGPIHRSELPRVVRPSPMPSTREERVLAGERTLAQAVGDLERDVILRALSADGFCQTRAARRLGITRRMLKYRMDQFGISDRGAGNPTLAASFPRAAPTRRSP